MKINYLDSKKIVKLSEEILGNNKAEKITCINIKNKTSYADFMIIATCTSSRHMNAVSNDLVNKLKKKGIFCPQPEGRPQYDWAIIDAGDVVIHLFRKELRLRYNLEKLWNLSLDH